MGDAVDNHIVSKFSSVVGSFLRLVDLGLAIFMIRVADSVSGGAAGAEGAAGAVGAAGIEYVGGGATCAATCAAICAAT